MDKKAKNILQYLFWGVVAVVLVWFCFRSVDWEQFRAALRVCRWEYVLLAMVLGTLVIYLQGNRWRMLLTPIDPAASRLTCFNAYNICMAVNLAVPRAGEVARLGYVVKHSAVDAEGRRLLSLDKALGTLVVERVWDVIVMLGMMAALLVFMWERFGAFMVESFSGAGWSALLVWGTVGLLALAGAFLLLCYKLRKRNGLWSRVWSFIAGIWSGLGSFLHMKRAWLFLLYTLLIWVLYWLTSACILWALQDMEAFQALSMADAFFLMVAGSMASLIPVPGGFGAYHGVVAGALLSIWNVPLGTGMIFATLNHESQVLAQAICGLVSYLHESFFRKG